ncbi:MAG: hypothetical protein HKP03_09630 [Xanthomonadales bacterium]|nr:hypothetical protein [Gammaproteobacteria bacterium]NNK33550.1 hypothetical protein [Xanthomonadales bacterium]NNK38729.1 hypothetical protein [Xanthomonadales bacterium]
MNDKTGKLTRGIGWLLFLGALLIVLGAGALTFLRDPSMTLFWKAVITALWLGLAFLFVSVLRQRLVERKADRYKDVEI